MIVFDFEILRETDLDNVIWREIGAAPFCYSCFLGDIVFEVDDVDLSVLWGWVPVFDFAFQMRRVADALSRGEDQVYSFTESDFTIAFTVQGCDRRVLARCGRVALEGSPADRGCAS